MKKTDDKFEGFLIGIIFTIAWIILLAILAASCASAEITYTEYYPSGALYEENDTIINGDTLTIWNQLK